MDGTMKKLPEDMRIYILLRLPVKSLTRFKCVTKSWHTLIQSFNFINFHLNRKTTTKDEFILFRRSTKHPDGFSHVLSFLVDHEGRDDLDPICPDIDMPYLTTGFASSTSHQFTGPSNGLILLTDSLNFLLLNPATRSYRLLPPNPFCCPRGFLRLIYGVGFGYDSIQKNYKVIRVSRVYGDPPYNDRSEMSWESEIYDSGTDSWRQLTNVDQELPGPYMHPYSELFYKGTFHWYAQGHMRLLLCFDINTENFRTMQVPKTCAVRDEKCHSLVVFDESLTFICYPDPRRESSPVQETIEIWIMQEYSVNESWIKKYTIRPPPIESPLAIWKDRLLLLQDKSGDLIAYDLNLDEVKEFNLHGHPESLRVIVYKESLAPIPIGNTQVEKF